VRVEAAVDGFVTVEQQTTASASAPAVLHFALERDLTAVQNATGTLVVIYQPEDATVIVDDQPVGSQSPVRVEGISLFGDHQLRIEKLGFETHTDTFRLESADVQTMQMQLVTAQEVGTVNIRSNPAGARIYVNDEEVGVTPLEGLELVADQEYRIRLERDGATFRTRVILDPGSLQNIDGELRRAVERPRPAAPAATGPAATPEPPAAAPEPPAAPAAPAYQLLE
jgi:alkylated DNA repair dioxygenase AlkB